MSNKPEQVLVRWLDSSGSKHSWFPLVDAINPKEFGLVNCVSVGFLIAEREDCVILASGYDEENDAVLLLTAIPKVCIQGGIVELKEPNEG